VSVALASLALDSPATLLVDAPKNRIIVTNRGFFSTGAGNPGVFTFPP
jgi:hypothetical protein